MPLREINIQRYHNPYRELRLKFFRKVWKIEFGFEFIKPSTFNTPIRGFSTIFKKSAWDLVYPADMGDWKLKNTDFSRKNQNPGFWWSISHGFFFFQRDMSSHKDFWVVYKKSQGRQPTIKWPLHSIYLFTQSFCLFDWLRGLAIVCTYPKRHSVYFYCYIFDLFDFG